MKTSIFNMAFTLPPMVEMTEVGKEMPAMTHPAWSTCNAGNTNCLRWE